MNRNPLSPAGAAAAVAAAGAALAQPAVRDLGLLPGDAAVAPAHSGQTAPAAARGGDTVLLAWMDDRARQVGGGSVQTDYDIFAIRLDAQGRPLDAAPFAVCAQYGEQRNPKVTWNGENWLVSFESQDPVGGYFGTNVRAVRVAPSGQVLDATALLLAPEEQFWWVGGQAGQWLVTTAPYHAGGYGTYLAGRRLGGNGVFLDPAPAMLMDWTYVSSDNRVLAAGGEYLVCGVDWNTRGFKARRVGLDGRPVGPEFTLPGGALGTDGQAYYAAWLSDFTNLVGSPMSRSGVLQNPQGTLITNDFQFYSVGDITHDGANWWVLWSAANIVRTARVAPSGAVLDPGGVRIPVGSNGTNNNAYNMQAEPVPGGGVRLFWYDGRGSLGGDPNVFTIPVSAANAPGEEVLASTATPAQHGPDLAGGPAGNIAVAWLSEEANNDRVLVHFLSAAGTPLRPEPVEVWRGPSLSRPFIAWNGGVYLLTWSDTSIKARRMYPDGSFVDPAPFEVMPGFDPAVEALGDDFLVAGARYGSTPQFIDARARRIDGPTGALLDPSPLALGGGYVSGGVRVRSDGSRWLVTYHSHWSHNSSQSDAVYNIVRPDGTFTPAANPTTTSGGAGTPDVAFSGRAYLFVWRSNTLSNANNYISGRIMNADGSFVTGDFVIAEAPGRQLRPVVDWDGSAFVVAWDDQRHQQAFFDARTDAYAARVSESGAVLDPAGVPIQRGPHGDAAAAVLGVDGRTLVATSRFSLTPPFDSYRVGLTWIGDAPCYADCDTSTGVGNLDIFDFLCFQNRYDAGSPYACDCDTSTGPGACDVFDFLCFQNAFAAGCR